MNKDKLSEVMDSNIKKKTHEQLKNKLTCIYI